MNALAKSFLDICYEENSTVTIEEIRNNALSKLSKGELLTFTSSSLNGKSSTKTVSLSADKVLEAASWAIREFNRGTITAVSFDFSRLS